LMCNDAQFRDPYNEPQMLKHQNHAS
jgi:hypothetical protein